MIFQANANQKAGVPKFRVEKIDMKVRSSTRNKYNHYTVIQVSVYWENRATLNMCNPKI